MNLFFRLLKVIVSLWLRPRHLQPLDTGVLHLHIWPNDLDTNGHVNNGRYLTLMDLGRFDFLMRAGLGRIGFRARWVPVLAAVMVRFRRSLHIFEKVELRTRLLGWDATWIYLEQTLWSRSGLAAVAYLRGVFLRRGAKVPMAEVIAALGFQGASPELPRDLTDWLAADEAMYRHALAHAQDAGSGAAGGGGGSR